MLTTAIPTAAETKPLTSRKLSYSRSWRHIEPIEGDAHRVSEFLMCNEQQLVEAVRAACIKVALVAYEEGGVLGLCAEGRWEYAISAMQQLNVAEVLDAPMVIPVGEKEKHGEKSRD